MTADLRELLSVVDQVLTGIGAVLTVAYLLYWSLWKRRDPLADVPARSNQVVPEAVLLPVLVWLICGSGLSMLSGDSVVGKLSGAWMIWAGNVAQLFGALACLWVGAKFFRGGVKRFLFGDLRIARQSVAGIGYLLAALSLCYWVMAAVSLILNRVDPNYNFHEHQVIDALRGEELPIVTIWIGTVLIAPLAEELFFRGLLQTCLENLVRSRWICVICTAAIFGAIHAGGGDTPQPHVVPALTLLGILLGMLYIRTGSLVAPVVLHALFNAKTLLWETLAPAGG